MKLNKRERQVVEEMLKSLEEQARLWERYGLIVLFLALLVTLYGGQLLLLAFNDATEIRQQSVVSLIDPSQIPADPLERDVWIIDGLRKTAAILEARMDYHISVIFQAAIGMFLILFGPLSVVFVLIRRRNGARYRVMAKILRAKYEEEFGQPGAQE